MYPRPGPPARAGVAAFAFALAGLSLATPARAATPTASPGARPSTVVARHTVTLLTGDAVVLEQMADGRQVATVHPPADRTRISYQNRVSHGHAYVIPGDAVPLLAAGKLDQEVFDVTQLVDDGYDDAHVASTPLIVQYPKTRLRAPAAPALPGTKAGTTLASINAVAVRASKAEAATFWSTVAAPPSAATDGAAPHAALAPAAAAIGKIWLNGRVHVALKDSVPQIGAPQAWAAGFDGTGVKVAILDTGIDESHPDLAGKVVAAKNFSTDADTLDHFGHGTHVASIVAGTGAASGGVYKGVAPGATLVNAKVLDSNGNGDDASIIAGMEWAVAQGVKVANMSLGTNAPVDGTDDPMVQAVDDLSESTGVLFAIAAGNLGSGDSTIASPGWADDAITVGAVDKSDLLAGFSSRGPRLGDFGVKPDITAPGVDIIAARAAGTDLGPIVDNNYQQLSGTSMATPHVAGAAAILAQEYPGDTGTQLKDLLISTAKPGNYSVYQQGSGRVDVARAFRQQVYASPGTVNLGYFPYPQTGHAPVARSVTYHNGGATDVTLSLSLSITGAQGKPAPDGFVTVSQPSLTVPAGGDASVDVTVHPDGAPFDRYGGALVATAGDTVVRTSLGAYIEQQMFNVTVPAVAHDGRPAAGISQVELWGPTIGGFQTQYYSGGSTPTFRVPAGTYSLMGYIFTMDEPNLFALGVSMVGKPQLVVDRDVTVTLDATKATRIQLNTAKPSAPSTFQLGYHRALGGLTFDSSFVLSPPIDQAFAAPSDKVTAGDFEFWSKWTLIAPPLSMTVRAKGQDTPLEPLLMTNSPTVDGTNRASLVYAGFGRPEDYAGVDAKGKVVLVSRGAGVTFHDKAANAAAAGAVAVIVFNNVPGLLFGFGGNPGTVAVPIVGIEQGVGLGLVDLLNQGPATVEYSGTSVSPYEYDLFLPSPNQVTAGQALNIDNSNTSEIDAVYTGTGAAGLTGSDTKYGLRPWTTFLFGTANTLARPLHRTEFVSATPDLWWWHLAWENYPFDGEFDGQVTAYQPRSHSDERWFDAVQRPGMPAGLTGWEDSGAPAFREGDQFTVFLFPYVDSAQHYGWSTGGDTATMSLYQGDTLLASGTVPQGTFPAVPGQASYRLVTDQKRSTPWWDHSTEVATTWTFQSGTAAARTLLPLVQVGYDLQLDDLNRAPRQGYTFTLTAGHQSGVDGPAVQNVRAWSSYDDGATWTPVQLIVLGNGKQLALVNQQAPAGSTAVSLRVSASDAAGNSIDQTIIRAYGLN
jgi:subtilisin family serine protease